MDCKIKFVPLTTFITLILSLFGSAILTAQIPDKFTNLQVFPKDISQGELLGNMKSFALGLGVRCQFCHVGEEGMPLSQFDFSSDEKEHKKKARIMIQMRNAINQQFLTKLGDMSQHAIQVECVTCHRGQSEPRMLADVLHEEITENGIDAGIAKYRELREKHYGGFAYDFGEMTLSFLAERFAKREQKVDEAIAVFKLNVEFFPESWMSYYGLGEMYSMQKDKENALENYKKALEIQPNPRIQKKIDELSGK